eukprot:c9728_g1_i1.p1 GENE.c9728_g1_i1~~c9728_g1_i1.p1  ORF type:complete len:272 (-),score=77.28 c9728_g1_i1:8-802(-)
MGITKKRIDEGLESLAVGSVLSLLPLAVVAYIIAFILLYIPFTCVPMLLYFIWIFFIDKSPKTGTATPFLKNIILWKYYANHFPIKLIKTGELDPKKSYIIGYHPHGVISMGAYGGLASNGAGFSKLFPGITTHLVTLPVNFFIPFIREFHLRMGLCDSSPESLHNVLKSSPGSALVLVVGGAQESLLAEPGKHAVILSTRKGFIRQAVKANADLVPCYAFGENNLFKTIAFSEKSIVYKIQVSKTNKKSTQTKIIITNPKPTT